MKTVWLIMQKEWKTFFHTPFAMLVVPLFFILSGSYFASNLDAYMTFAHPNQGIEGIQGLNVMGFLLLPFYESLFNVFIFIVPLITMRSFAEEKKSATYELLVSYPIPPWTIVIGKYLGLLAIVMMLLAGSMVYPIITAWKGQPYWPQIMSTTLGYSLFLMLFVAIGLWASLLTENQLVAAIITYAAFFLSFLIGYMAHLVGAPFDAWFSNFLVFEHLQSFRTGLVFLGDIMVFLGLTSILLVIAYYRLRRHYIR